jgi:TonB family protein
VPMLRHKFLLRAVAAVVWFLAYGPTALAQDAGVDAIPPPEQPAQPPANAPNDAGPPSDSTPPKAHPPEAIDAVAAEYSAEAIQARVEGTVVLRLSIDAEGTVTEAEVIEPAGHGFDEAARAAALRARYRPARRGDTTIASRILVRVEFRLPEAPPTGTLEGRILRLCLPSRYQFRRQSPWCLPLAGMAANAFNPVVTEGARREQRAPADCLLRHPRRCHSVSRRTHV